MSAVCHGVPNLSDECSDADADVDADVDADALIPCEKAVHTDHFRPICIDPCKRQLTGHSIAVCSNCSFERVVMTHTHGNQLKCCLGVRLVVCSTVHFCFH